MRNATILAYTCMPGASEQLHLTVPQIPPTQDVPSWTHYLLSSLFSLMFLIAANITTIYCNNQTRNLKGILDCYLLLISKIQSLGLAHLLRSLSSFHSNYFSPCRHHLLPGLLKGPLCGSPYFQSSSLPVAVTRLSLQKHRSESWHKTSQCLLFAVRTKSKIPKWLKNLYWSLLAFPSLSSFYCCLHSKCQPFGASPTHYGPWSFCAFEFNCSSFWRIVLPTLQTHMHP